MRKFQFRTIAFVLLVSVLAFAPLSFSQPQEQTVKVVVAPDRADWQYDVGDKVKFNISAFQYGNILEGVTVRYEIKPEKMDAVKSGDITMKKDGVTIDGGTMKEPGFLRCWAYVEIDGKKFNGCGTAGFEPLRIEPTTNEPDDFLEFWNKAKAELAKIPLDAKVTLLPEKCTETVNVYHVNLQNYQSSRLYGILCVPKKEGQYPALLNVPGAGIRPYNGVVSMAEKGVITFQIGIHGIPVTMETGVYNDLRSGALRNYPTFNLDNRDNYYFKRVFLGCVRAMDFIYSRREFDGSNLAVTGGSQGGLLSIVSAALDSRVKRIGLYCPAYCDVTGYLEGRAGGWPHMFRKGSIAVHGTEDKIQTSKYYDAVNFARHVTVPALLSWGYNDTTCSPTSMYAAYNTLKGPKSLFLVLDARHWIYPEQSAKTSAWLENHLVGDGSMAPR